jgi:bacterioferritin-associated ferredoxin
MSSEHENETVVCRCEEVTLGEIRKWIADGYTTFDELKRMLRVGMGPCQGRGCRDIALREISRLTGEKISDIPPGTIRPPIKPIKISLAARNYTRGESK